MNQGKLFYAMFKTYVLFAVSLGAVILTFLAFVLDMDNRTIEVNLLELLLFLGVFAASSLLYSLWTAKRITGPLEQIASAIRRMEEGKYSERLNIAAGYEFSVIQQRFNDMAESLERSEAENRRLQESKRRMLADLSHDLKTPITTIQGYAKALELGILENEEEKKRFLRLISNKATHVTALIDQIFNLAKLDRPGYPMAMELVDVAELLREIAADFYEPLEAKNFQLEVEIPAEEVMAKCDPNLIRRAVSNLLSNALQHNPPGTRVTVQLTESEQCLSLAVADNGVGISDELKKTIFDPFVRGDAARREEGSSGLGLAIARQIAELHGGELHLSNTQGSTTFELMLRI
ncbi:sensor histidine kinase [Paenibacillus sp. TH7-28]